MTKTASWIVVILLTIIFWARLLIQYNLGEPLLMIDIITLPIIWACIIAAIWYTGYESGENAKPLYALCLDCGCPFVQDVDDDMQFICHDCTDLYGDAGNVIPQQGLYE